MSAASRPVRARVTADTASDALTDACLALNGARLAHPAATAENAAAIGQIAERALVAAQQAVAAYRVAATTGTGPRAATAASEAA